jgi:metal-responsive CopG/Arc/MetJ family transcriptional regulator
MARHSPDAVLQLRLSETLLSNLDCATEALETNRSEYARRAIREALLRDEPLLARFAA